VGFQLLLNLEKSDRKPAIRPFLEQAIIDFLAFSSLWSLPGKRFGDSYPMELRSVKRDIRLMAVMIRRD